MLRIKHNLCDLDVIVRPYDVHGNILWQVGFNIVSINEIDVDDYHSLHRVTVQSYGRKFVWQKPAFKHRAEPLTRDKWVHMGTDFIDTYFPKATTQWGQALSQRGEAITIFAALTAELDRNKMFTDADTSTTPGKHAADIRNGGYLSPTDQMFHEHIIDSFNDEIDKAMALGAWTNVENAFEWFGVYLEKFPGVADHLTHDLKWNRVQLRTVTW